MTTFLANLLLAVIWSAMTGEFSLTNLLVGFGLGYLALLFAQRVMGRRSPYFGKARRVLSFSLFFLVELIKANWRVAVDIATPGLRIRPGVVAIPLAARTDGEITLLANLITMTPGTLSLDVADDRTTLYLHAMYVDDAEALRREIKDGFERRVLELLR